MGLIPPRAPGRLIPMNPPDAAQSHARCASLAPSHLAAHSPRPKKFLVLIAPSRPQVQRSAPPTAYLTNTPCPRLPAQSATTIHAAEAAAAPEIRVHFVSPPHRARSARNIPAQSETRGTGHPPHAHGPLQNCARHFPAAANQVSSVRCEFRR